MNEKWLDFLCCPKCKADLVKNIKDDIELLLCSKCDKKYPVLNEIPRFVKSEGYADGFGFQWNLFKKTQHDSFSNIKHSKNRFHNETGWKEIDLKNNTILDAGCGNGRFTEVALKCGANVIALDLSGAVDSCQSNMKNQGFNSSQFLVIQASFYDMPIKNNILDKAYSLGVLQHTPDRRNSLVHIVEAIKKGGEVSFWVYEKSWRSLIGYKYYFRTFTKYLSMKVNWKISKLLVNIFFPIAWQLHKVKKIGMKLIRIFLPFAFRFNDGMSYSQSKEWSLLDTFDNLSPRYDNPITEIEIVDWLKKENIKNINRLNTPGLAVNGIKE